MRSVLSLWGDKSTSSLVRHNENPPVHCFNSGALARGWMFSNVSLSSHNCLLVASKASFMFETEKKKKKKKKIEQKTWDCLRAAANFKLNWKIFRNRNAQNMCHCQILMQTWWHHNQGFYLQLEQMPLLHMKCTAAGHSFPPLSAGCQVAPASGTHWSTWPEREKLKVTEKTQTNSDFFLHQFQPP